MSEKVTKWPSRRSCKWTGERFIATDKDVRINGDINSPEIRLLGAEGQQLGIVSLTEAQRMAEEAELDLVEIAPTAKPPVCRIMDYGKFKYREAKKAHEAKLKQKQIQVKEIKFRPGTDDGDYNIKVRNLIRFLSEGDKTKITLRFRGREMAHQELGVALLKRVEADLAAYGQVEQFPKMEGRQMIMIVAPKKHPEKDKPTKASPPVMAQEGKAVKETKAAEATK